MKYFPFLRKEYNCLHYYYYSLGYKDNANPKRLFDKHHKQVFHLCTCITVTTVFSTLEGTLKSLIYYLFFYKFQTGLGVIVNVLKTDFHWSASRLHGHKKM